MSHLPSVYQAAIYENVARGTGHCLVSARAGSGKTWSIMGALACVPAGLTIALFAFNKSIALALGAKAPRGVEVKTLHAHGLSACRRAFPGCTVDDDKSKGICLDLFGEPDRDDALRSRYAAVADLVRKAKDVLVARGDVDMLDALVDRFDIDAPEKPEDRAEFVAMAMRVLIRSSEITHVIDFSDMCWLPIVLDLRVWAFDRVFVDETQDLSPTQIELLLKTVKKGGRICAVGDDRQAIYAFRGADVDTIPTLIQRLDAAVLPLSVTYRCCREVVALAKTEVADFKAAPDAPEGHVENASEERMLNAAREGDMIVSRTNAPLLGYCLKFLKAGKRAAVKGKDVGAGILRLIEKSKARSVPALVEWLDKWHAREVARLEKRDRSTDEVSDRRDCILALTEDAESVAEVTMRAERLFVNGDGADAERITLGTTHKLKGLEATTVWMLDNYRRSRSVEEANCWYVAVTRAKDELFIVDQKKTAPAAP